MIEQNPSQGRFTQLLDATGGHNNQSHQHRREAGAQHPPSAGPHQRPIPVYVPVPQDDNSDTWMDEYEDSHNPSENMDRERIRLANRDDRGFDRHTTTGESHFDLRLTYPYQAD